MDLGRKRKKNRRGQGEQRRNFWKKILSWQDEWKIKQQNESLLKRAVPSLLPTQANLYFWNEQKGCQLKPMLESPCSKCSPAHVQSGGSGMNWGSRERRTWELQASRSPGPTSAHTLFPSNCTWEAGRTGAGPSVKI